MHVPIFWAAQALQEKTGMQRAEIEVCVTWLIELSLWHTVCGSFVNRVWCWTRRWRGIRGGWPKWREFERCCRQEKKHSRHELFRWDRSAFRLWFWIYYRAGGAHLWYTSTKSIFMSRTVSSHLHELCHVIAQTLSINEHRVRDRVAISFYVTNSVISSAQILSFHCTNSINVHKVRDEVSNSISMSRTLSSQRVFCCCVVGTVKWVRGTYCATS